MLTVKQYADSRDISEGTAKNWINRLALDLVVNPIDKRQRLLSTAQAAQLDQAFNVRDRAAPAGSDVIVVTPYERSPEVALTIAESSLNTIDYSYQRPEENQLLQHLQQKAATIAAQNQQALAQVMGSTQASRDTTAALNAIQQMALVQEAQQEAIRDFHLKRQVYEQQTTALEMAAAGITPLPDNPTAQPVEPEVEPEAVTSPSVPSISVPSMVTVEPIAEPAGSPSDNWL